jgi:uncharacterized membrane protein
LDFRQPMKLHVQRGAQSVPVSDEKFYLVVLAFLASVTAMIVASFALILHRNFLTIACDTAVLQSGIVNTLHGNLLSNNGFGGPNILGAHTTFLLLLIAPIYALAPSADTLFILQICGVYSTVIPLYFIAQEILRRPLIAFCIALAALVSPLLIQMAMAPFHLETWIAAAVLWSYFCYLRNNLIGFLTSLLFAVCCGEQAALIYIALGSALLFVEDGFAWRKRYGTAALLAGFIWIIQDVAVIGPMARGSHSFNIFAYNYSQWDIKTVSQLPMAVALHPVKAIALLINPQRWFHLALNIGLPLVIALFSRRTLILLAPFPLYFLMSDQEFYLYFHAYYYSFAFFAGYLGVLLFLARPNLPERWLATVVAGTFFFNVLLLCFAAGFYFQLEAGCDNDFSGILHAEFDKIPTDATVYTPHRYSAYLSNRQNMVIGDLRDQNLDFAKMMNAQFNATNVHPEQVDFIVCDFKTDQCGWRLGFLNADMTKHRADNIRHLLDSGQWQVFWSQSDVVILRRAGE